MKKYSERIPGKIYSWQHEMKIRETCENCGRVHTVATQGNMKCQRVAAHNAWKSAEAKVEAIRELFVLTDTMTKEGDNLTAELNSAMVDARIKERQYNFLMDDLPFLGTGLSDAAVDDKEVSRNSSTKKLEYELESIPEDTEDYEESVHRSIDRFLLAVDA